MIHTLKGPPKSKGKKRLISAEANSTPLPYTVVHLRALPDAQHTFSKPGCEEGLAK